MTSLAQGVEMYVSVPCLFWPGAVLAFKFLLRQRFPWWSVLILLLVGESILFLGSLFAEKEALLYQLEHGPQPPDPSLVERMVNDAGHTINLAFWPLFVIMISTFWFLLYGLAVGLRRAFRRAA